jgi:hypothetical protein
MNCNSPTKGRYAYRGVIVCGNCFSLARMMDRRAYKQVNDILEMYRESLRVSLAQGSLGTSTTILDKKSGVHKFPDGESSSEVRNALTLLFKTLSSKKTT